MADGVYVDVEAADNAGKTLAVSNGCRSGSLSNQQQANPAV